MEGWCIVRPWRKVNGVYRPIWTPAFVRRPMQMGGMRRGFGGRQNATALGGNRGVVGYPEWGAGEEPPPPAGSDALAEPVYASYSGTKKLHLVETWDTGVGQPWNGKTIADIDSVTHAGLGSAYEAASGIKAYGELVTDDGGDGFESVAYVSTEYGTDPPIPNDHGTHLAAYHWLYGGHSGNGYNAGTGISEACGGKLNGWNGASPWMIRGFDHSGTYLNEPALDSVVYEFSVRERGVNWFEGKTFDLNPGGALRFNFRVTDAVPNSILYSKYYSGSPGSFTPLYDGLPPTPSTVGMQVNRENIVAYTGFPTATYFQNINWGLTAGTFAWGGGLIWPSGSANADGAGTGTSMWEAGWLKYKIRITREPSGTAFGGGRIELWIGPTPGSLIKIMEWLGDAGQIAEGVVYVDPTGSSLHLSGRAALYNLCENRYTGGSIVDIGSMRVWSHDRLEL